MRLLVKSLKPVARAVKYGWLYHSARRRARGVRRDVRPRSQASPAASPASGPSGRETDPPITFIIGCGRSGTTILGDCLAAHPTVRYLFEPYHLWAALDPRLDCLHLYVADEAKLCADAEDAPADASVRFNRLFSARARAGEHLIEKTPLNALRLGYLIALSPEARFVHVVRDGVEVAQSIARIDATFHHGEPYRIWGKPELNPWWGVRDVKWRTLARDARQAGFAFEGLESLRGEARGAVEWLLSLHEIDRHREALGERLLEFRLIDLLTGAESVLRRICGFLGIDDESSWLASCRGKIRPAPVRDVGTIALPEPLVTPFNEYQARFGFSGRATVDESSHEPMEHQSDKAKPA